ELLEAVALTLLAAAAGHVERKRASRQAERLRPRQPGEDLADLVEGLHVGDGVRARRATDRLLVDEPDAFQILETDQQIVLAGWREIGLEGPGPRPVERVVDERRLARAGHAADDRERAERQPQGDVLQVVLSRAGEHEVTARRPPDGGHRDRLASGQVA